jgi:radical SAM superfamily enzyme YgiQ (UPF0313 family)/CTP:phosphocholine cytidylyltransferase-like protein
MQALILAGGSGTRMQEHFPDTHKCMLLVAGKPVLQYQIECLKDNNIKNILIYVCYKKHQIKEYFKDGKDFGVNIRYIEDDEMHSTANHLIKAMPLLRKEFIVIYGDQVIKDVDFDRLYQFHRTKKSFLTFFMHKDFHPGDSDRIKINRANRIIGFGNVEGQTNTAMFVAQKSLIKFINNPEEDITRDLIPRVLVQRDCFALEADGYIKDIGTMERYKQAIVYINGGSKVLFIFPNMYTPYSFSPAIQTLSAHLKKNGIETGLIHINNEFGVPDDDIKILEHIRSHNPKLIAFTSTSFEFDRVKQLADLIRKRLIKREHMHMRIVLGGSHATISPFDLKYTQFDAFCIGEGEKPLLNYIRSIKTRDVDHSIKSLWFRRSFIRNPPDTIFKNLNDLPFLDLDIMDTKRILDQKNNWFSISFSRGCPFECSYCINHIYKRIKGKGVSDMEYLRKKTPKNAIREMQYILSKFKDSIKVFNLDDDLIMLDKAWMKEFCALYKKRIFSYHDIPFVINARVTSLDLEMATRLKNAGCCEVRIGVESGDKDIRYNILNKPITDQQIIDAFKNCRKAGLRADAFVMIGIPGENHEKIRKTMDLMVKIKPFLIRLSILYPYKGSKIYDYCRKNDMISGDYNHLTDMFSNSCLNLKEINRSDIVRYHLLFAWYLNARIYKKTIYNDLLASYASGGYARLLGLKGQIRKQDEEADNNFKRPHFRFFKGNPYYIEYVGGKR